MLAACGAAAAALLQQRSVRCCMCAWLHWARQQRWQLLVVGLEGGAAEGGSSRQAAWAAGRCAARLAAGVWLFVRQAAGQRVAAAATGSGRAARVSGHHWHTGRRVARRVATAGDH